MPINSSHYFMRKKQLLN